MTRAMERLIVSGSIGAPGDASDETPIGWALSRLGLDDEARNGDLSVPLELDRGEATVVLRVDRGQPEAPVEAPVSVEVPAAEPGQLALFEGSGEALLPPAPRLRELTVLPEPPLHRVSRLSYSALSLFERCSYRYYAERVAGMKPRAVGAWERGRGRACIRPRSVTPCIARSSRSTSRRRRPPGRPARRRPRVVSGGHRARARPGRDARLRRTALVARRADRGSRRRASRAAVRVRPRRRAAQRTPRRPLARGPRALVLDYKTNVLDGRVPRDVVEDEYRAQRLVYALACFRAGADDVEIVYQFLDAPEDVVSASYTRGRRRRARAGARGGDRADPRRGLQADPEPVRVLGVPRTRSGLRRARALWPRTRRRMTRGSSRTRAEPPRVPFPRADRGALRHPRQPPGAGGGPRRPSVREPRTRSCAVAISWPARCRASASSGCRHSTRTCVSSAATATARLPRAMTMQVAGAAVGSGRSSRPKCTAGRSRWS